MNTAAWTSRPPSAPFLDRFQSISRRHWPLPCHLPCLQAARQKSARWLSHGGGIVPLSPVSYLDPHVPADAVCRQSTPFLGSTFRKAQTNPDSSATRCVCFRPHGPRLQGDLHEIQIDGPRGGPVARRLLNLDAGQFLAHQRQVPNPLEPGRQRSDRRIQHGRQGRHQD